MACRGTKRHEEAHASITERICNSSIEARRGTCLFYHRLSQGVRYITGYHKRHMPLFIYQTWYSGTCLYSSIKLRIAAHASIHLSNLVLRHMPLFIYQTWYSGTCLYSSIKLRIAAHASIHLSNFVLRHMPLSHARSNQLTSGVDFSCLQQAEGPSTSISASKLLSVTVSLRAHVRM